MVPEPLNSQLADYPLRWCRFQQALSPAERQTQAELPERFAKFLTENPNGFHRTCQVGHLTGSALVVSPRMDQVLLTLHAKLGKWMQLGGHADGETDMAQVAMREAEEESGLTQLRWAPSEGGPFIFDLDIHWIPAGREPGHYHYDVRYLIVAAQPEKIVCSPESHELRWFEIGQAAQMSEERSLTRLFDKLKSAY